MKISELITPKTTTSSLSRPFDMDKLASKFNKERDSYSSGSYALGSNDKKDPHMYSKKNYYPSVLDKDAYYQYVMAIKPYIGENPYFPRVYVISLTKDSKGRVIPKFTIEKLKQSLEFSYEALLGMAERMFKNFNPPDFEDQLFNIITKRIQNDLISGDFSDIKDPNLEMALRLITKVKNLNANFNYDVPGNVMIRGTNVGPQLVITDPLWDRDRESQITN